MAPRVARRARGTRGRVRDTPPAGARARSAEDWWWDRLAPSGSGYHLLQSDSMLLVLPGPGPARARAHRRATRRAQRLPFPGSRAAGAKAKPRPSPGPAPAPQQGPDPGWGDRIPLEILLQIFGLLVAADGPVPFLGRYPGSIERSGLVQADMLPPRGGQRRTASERERVHTCARERSLSGVHLQPHAPDLS